jgi:hypothetical protein
MNQAKSEHDHSQLMFAKDWQLQQRRRKTIVAAKAHLKSTYNRLLPPKILLSQKDKGSSASVQAAKHSITT